VSLLSHVIKHDYVSSWQEAKYYKLAQRVFGCAQLTVLIESSTSRLSHMCVCSTHRSMQIVSGYCLGAFSTRQQ